MIRASCVWKNLSIWVDVSSVHSSQLVRQLVGKLTHQKKLYVSDSTNLFDTFTDDAPQILTTHRVDPAWHIHTWRTTNTCHASCGPSLRKNGIEMWLLLQNTYKDELVLSQRTVYDWCARLKEGRPSVELLPHVSHPSTSSTDTNVNTITVIVKENGGSVFRKGINFCGQFLPNKFFSFFSYVEFLVGGMRTQYTQHVYNCHGNEVATWFLHSKHRNDCTAHWKCLSRMVRWKKN